MRIRDGCSLRQESEGVWNSAMGMCEVYEERIHYSCATDPSSSASCHFYVKPVSLTAMEIEICDRMDHLKAAVSRSALVRYSR